MTLVDEILKIKSDDKTLRSFGYLMGGCCLAAALFIYIKHKALNIYLPAAAIPFFAAALLRPGLLLPLQKVWMGFALCLGWVMTRVILTVFFYLFLTPFAVIARLSGKKFLERGIDNDKPSYWDEHKNLVPDKTRYENQF